MAFNRQLDLVNKTELDDLKVAILGCGAIGSYTALTLTKMGVKSLTLYDDDHVSLHNISNQFFTRDSIDKSKVQAVKEECLRQAPENNIIIVAHPEKYVDQFIDARIIIAAMDNIEGRNLALNQARKNLVTQLFIDGRMNAEAVRMFAFNPKDFDKSEYYYTNFIDGVENVEGPCTAKSIIYTVQYAASMITNTVKKFINKEQVPFELSFMFPELYLVKNL